MKINRKSSEFIPLLLVIIIGISLRLINLGYFGTWSDECVSLNNTNGIFFNDFNPGNVFHHNLYTHENTISNVIKVCLRDKGNGMVYYILLHWWTGIFGNSDFAARSLSAIFGVLLIIVVYFFTNDLFKNKIIALCASAFIAINPQLITFSQIARTYALTNVLICCSVWILYLIYEESLQSKYDTKKIIIYAILTCIAFTGHFLSTYILLGEAVAFMLLFWDMKVFYRLAVVGVVAGLFFIVWYYVIDSEGNALINKLNTIFKSEAGQFQSGSNALIMPPTPYNLVAFITQDLLQNFGIGLQVFGLQIREIGLLLLLPLGFIVYIIVTAAKVISGKSVKYLVLLIALSYVYMIAMSLYYNHAVYFESIYLQFATPYAMVLMGCALYYIFNSDKKYLLKSLMVIYILMLGVSLIPVFSGKTHGSGPIKPNPYYALSKKMKSLVHPGDTLVFHNFVDANMMNLYLSNSDTVTQVLEQDTMLHTISLRNGSKSVLLIDLSGSDCCN